jgi:microcystin-dependent protein
MRGRWLTPDSGPGTARRYHFIGVPDNVEWESIFWGALDELRFTSNYEQFGSVDPVDIALDFAGLYDEWRLSSPLVGTIFAHAKSQAPSGSLPCDGTTYNRTDYPDLFDALDAGYHIGSTQFKTPDLRGRTLLGDGTGTGLTNRAFAGTGGAETHTLVTAEMPSHQHAYTAPAALPFAYTPGPAPAGAAAGTPANTVSTGGSGAHNNMQPWLALHYAIWAR